MHALSFQPIFNQTSKEVSYKTWKPQKLKGLKKTKNQKGKENHGGKKGLLICFGRDQLYVDVHFNIVESYSYREMSLVETGSMFMFWL